MNMIQEMESDLDRDPREVTMDRIAERLDRICTTDIEYQRAVTVMESLSRGFWDRYGQEDLDELAKMMIRFAHERAAKAVPCARFDGQYKETIYWRSERGCRRWANITRRISNLKR